MKYFTCRQANCEPCLKPIQDRKKCSECNVCRPEWQFAWTKDGYGIPYRKVCDDCYQDVQNYILGYTYDYLDAGESLYE